MAKNTSIKNSPESLNRIVDSTQFEGTLQCQSNIRIDGIAKGIISSKQKIVLGNTAKVEGEISCENAEIEGVFTGKIHVKSLLSLKSTAKIEGEIITGKISIEPGATFSGSCTMGNSVEVKNNDNLGAK